MLLLQHPADFPENLDNKAPSAIHYFIKSQRKAGFSLSAFSHVAAIQKKPPQQEAKNYSELPGSSIEDQRKIIELFTTLGSYGKVTLLFQYKDHLEQLGREIQHVHPLKLIGVIFSHANMKEYMDDIYNDYFKWKNFIDGFEPNMNHELMKNNLLQYIDDFAKDVNLNPDSIRPYFSKKDWKGLIKYLIYN